MNRFTKGRVSHYSSIVPTDVLAGAFTGLIIVTASLLLIHFMQ